MKIERALYNGNMDSTTKSDCGVEAENGGGKQTSGFTLQTADIVSQ